MSLFESAFRKRRARGSVYEQMDDDGDLASPESAYVPPALPDEKLANPSKTNKDATGNTVTSDHRAVHLENRATRTNSMDSNSIQHPAAVAATTVKDDSYVAFQTPEKGGGDIRVSKPRNFLFKGVFKKKTGSEAALAKQQKNNLKFLRKQEKKERERIKKKKKQAEKDRKMALKLQEGEMKDMQAGDQIQLKDHGVWRPGIVEGIEEDTWGAQFYRVRWNAGGKANFARKKRKDVRPVIGGSARRVEQPHPGPVTHQLHDHTINTRMGQSSGHTQYAEVKIPVGVAPGSLLKTQVNGKVVDVRVPMNAVAGTSVRFAIPNQTRIQNFNNAPAALEGTPPIPPIVADEDVVAKVVNLAEDLDVLEITVPNGKIAGDRINVFIPGRLQPIRVTIPPGVASGQTFQAEANVPIPPQPKFTEAQKQFMAMMPADIQQEMLMNPSMLAAMMGPASEPTSRGDSSNNVQEIDQKESSEEVKGLHTSNEVSPPNSLIDFKSTTSSTSKVEVQDVQNSEDVDIFDGFEMLAPDGPNSSTVSLAVPSGPPPAYTTAVQAPTSSKSASPETSSSSNDQLLDRLRTANTMLKEGLISQAEFENTKRAILEKIKRS